MFRRMDDDGSRNLGYDEFRKGIDETGLELSEDGYKEMFAQFDKDGSGKLSIDEFLFSVRVSLVLLVLACLLVSTPRSHQCPMQGRELWRKLTRNWTSLVMAWSLLMI